MFPSIYTISASPVDYRLPPLKKKHKKLSNKKDCKTKQNISDTVKLKNWIGNIFCYTFCWSWSPSGSRLIPLSLFHACPMCTVFVRFSHIIFAVCIDLCLCDCALVCCGCVSPFCWYRLFLSPIRCLKKKEKFCFGRKF